MVGPSVELSLPPAHWFKFPPSNWPKILPAPSPEVDEWTHKAPFSINTTFYNDVLKPEFPVTFALIYLFSIVTWNSVNRKREYKPWAIAKSPIFHAFVMLHNVALAIYSLLTCAAMVRALSVSFPGFLGEHGLPGGIDALCKINGPRGFGDAMSYNATTYTWGSKNHKIHLGEDNMFPDTTDVGRIWNEGLAFWGWMFYMSKFYEVIDNVIVIIKGKRVSTLQAYHHAGAIICMWAGIRYMSPPIWLFVLFNSGIHFLMYSYYAFHQAGGPPRRAIKQTLTTLQISQFVIGILFAAAHLFISYSAPVAIPYTVRSIMSGMPSAITSATHAAASSLNSIIHNPGSFANSAAHHAASGVNHAAHHAGSALHSAASVINHGHVSKSLSSAASSVSGQVSSSATSFASSASATASSLASTATKSGSSLASSLSVQATATASSLASAALADDGFWLKKLLYRAAGREALAEAIRNSDGLLVGPEFDENLIPRTIEQIKEEVRYHTEYQTVRCLDSEGQAFAVWLNVLYLGPLAGLFLNFFSRTYRGTGKGKHPQYTASEAALSAARKTKSTIENAGRDMEDSLGALADEIEDGGENLKIEEGAKKVQKNVQSGIERLRQDLPDFGNFRSGDMKLEDAVESVKKGAENAAAKVRKGTNDAVQAVKNAVSDGSEKVHEESHSAKKVANQAGNKIKEEGQSVQKAANQAGDKIKEEGQSAKKAISEGTEKVKEEAQQAQSSPKKKQHQVHNDEHTSSSTPATTHPAAQGSGRHSPTKPSSTPSQSKSNLAASTDSFVTDDNDEDDDEDDHEASVDELPVSTSSSTHVHKGESFADAIKADGGGNSSNANTPSKKKKNHNKSAIPKPVGSVVGTSNPYSALS